MHSLAVRRRPSLGQLGKRRWGRCGPHQLPRAVPPCAAPTSPSLGRARLLRRGLGLLLCPFSPLTLQTDEGGRALLQILSPLALTS